MRTYARALGIKDADMIEALDQMSAGTYQGYLIKKYGTGASKQSSTPEPAVPPVKPQSEMQTKASEARKTDAMAAKPGTAKPAAADQKSAEQKPAADSAASAGAGQKSAQAKTGSSQKTEPAKTAAAASEAAGQKTASGTRFTTPKPMGGPRPSEVNWSDVSRGASRKSNVPVSAILIIALVFIALAAFGYWYLNSEDGFSGLFGSGTEETVRTAPAAERESDLLLSDTLDAPVAPDPGITARAVQTLPDTLSIVVYAATGNLEPFRVRADTFENRRPYWVEVGRGMRIQFINEIAVSGNLNRMLLLYNDRVITTFAETSAQGERVIRRSQFEEDPTLESFTQSGLPEGIEPPRDIIDRPLF